MERAREMTEQMRKIDPTYPAVDPRLFERPGETKSPALEQLEARGVEYQKYIPDQYFDDFILDEVVHVGLLTYEQAYWMPYDELTEIVCLRRAKEAAVAMYQREESTLRQIEEEERRRRDALQKT